MSTPVSLTHLSVRFAGIDIQFRRCGFDSTGRSEERGMPWRARIFTSKNERSEYRIEAYGATQYAAVKLLVDRVAELDKEQP